MTAELRYVFRTELADPSAFVAAGAVVRGDVVLGAQCSVWFGAVIRGDSERITIGPRSNVQDLAVLHADRGFPCTLGAGVTIGHAAIVHGAQIDDNVVVGMRSVVLNGAHIGANSIVAAGAVVPEGTQVPPGSLVMGIPARIKRQLAPDEIEYNRRAAAHYVELARNYAGENQLAAGRSAVDRRQV
jgi:carbonic anhydrase/acetyltransferase-like protein (isoleucine patch superfamily)